MSSVVVKSIDEERTRETMDAYAECLLSRHPEIEEVVVSGSFEKGSYAPRSDVDVFLVLSDYLPRSFPAGVDLFPFTREETSSRVPSPVLEAVRRSGWRYRRDP